MDEKSERTTNDGVGSVSRLLFRTFWFGSYSFHCRGGFPKTRLTDTFDHNKTLDFKHHDVVDNIATFTTPAFVCYCSRDLSSRRMFSRVKVCKALTSYLVIHLTDLTTLTAHI